jgi:hypothetical protein
MRFVNADDERAANRFKIKESAVRIVHRIDFPSSFLQRAKAVYDVQKKSNDEIMDRLLKGFFESRKGAPKAH